MAFQYEFFNLLWLSPCRPKVQMTEEIWEKEDGGVCGGDYFRKRSYMRDESDGRIQFTEKHDELLKRIFGKNMSFAHLKKMCEGNTDFYPEDELLPYVVGERGTGEDEFLADDIIWLLNVED